MTDPSVENLVEMRALDAGSAVVPPACFGKGVFNVKRCLSVAGGDACSQHSVPIAAKESGVIVQLSGTGKFRTDNLEK